MQHIKLMRSISTATQSAWKMWFFEELLVKASGPSHQIARRALPTIWLKREWLQLIEGCCTNICNSFESLRSQVPLEEGKTFYSKSQSLFPSLVVSCRWWLLHGWAVPAAQYSVSFCFYPD